ncbi:hypothetical protein [Streptomyces sp. NPDC058964]|uniref:hypothetical protein n=1 Tax=Streptomyces sp. NPDC058964 TaxID=3346681 RepID=UPI0036B407F1
MTSDDTTRTYSYDHAVGIDGKPVSGTTTPELGTLTTGPVASPKHRSGYHYDDAGNLIARTDDGKPRRCR